MVSYRPAGLITMVSIPRSLLLHHHCIETVSSAMIYVLGRESRISVAQALKPAVGNSMFSASLEEILARLKSPYNLIFE